MPNSDHFPAIFEALKQLLRPLAPPLVVEFDVPGRYSLNAPPSAQHPQGHFFGAVRLGKSYVSYHLMPVYVCPDLLASMSDVLRKRMQGKSCFNFTAPDTALFDELTHMTHAGFERYKRERWV
jgi:hypothetical protein